MTGNDEWEGGVSKSILQVHSKPLATERPADRPVTCLVSEVIDVEVAAARQGSPHQLNEVVDPPCRTREGVRMSEQHLQSYIVHAQAGKRLAAGWLDSPKSHCNPVQCHTATLAHLLITVPCNSTSEPRSPTRA